MCKHAAFCAAHGALSCSLASDSARTPVAAISANAQTETELAPLVAGLSDPVAHGLMQLGECGFTGAVAECLPDLVLDGCGVDCGGCA